jgi:hypothetical protein
VADRRRLERLCRYVIRPPVASGRLRFVDAETLVLSLKTHWADGTCQVVPGPPVSTATPAPYLHSVGLPSEPDAAYPT